MSLPNPKRAIIVGASSGLGRELARQLAADGWIVAGLARRTEPIERLNAGILAIEHDVTDYTAIPALLMDITQQLGGLDAFYYVAGAMPVVEQDEFNFEKDSSMLEVNCLGAVAWLNEAATRFQGVQAGTIVAISSVAGERGRAGQPVYNASKSFLNSYMESLRNRLSGHGVRVTTIKPGPMDTPMTAHLTDQPMMAVEVAAAKTIRLANSGREAFLSPVHAVIFAIIRNIPSAVMRRLKI